MKASRMKMIYEFRGKSVAAEQGRALANAAIVGLQTSRIQRRVERLPDAPDRQSVARAILAVEDRLVRAFWTIARQPIPVNASAPRQAQRCGIDYFHEQVDSFARFVDAAGGKWDSVAPRPSLPSSKAIDEANRTLDWLLLITDESLRKLLVVAATSKRGDAGRRMNWMLVRLKLPEFSQMPVRTLKWRYREALRIIVSELTLARVA